MNFLTQMYCTRPISLYAFTYEYLQDFLDKQYWGELIFIMIFLMKRIQKNIFFNEKTNSFYFECLYTTEWPRSILSSYVPISKWTTFLDEQYYWIEPEHVSGVCRSALILLRSMDIDSSILLLLDERNPFLRGIYLAKLYAS